MRQCSYDPKYVKKSWGLFHCPECGMLVQAGLPHPKLNYSFTAEENKLCEICDPVKNPLCNNCYRC